MSRAATMALGKARAVRPRLSSPPTLVLKIAGGLALLALWEIVVRSLAPAYVARPTGIARVFLDVLADRQFAADAAATSTITATMASLCLKMREL